MKKQKERPEKNRNKDDDSVTSRNKFETIASASSETYTTKNAAASSGWLSWILLAGVVFFIFKGLGMASKVSNVISMMPFGEGHDNQNSTAVFTSSISAPKHPTTVIDRDSIVRGMSVKAARRNLSGKRLMMGTAKYNLQGRRLSSGRSKGRRGRGGNGGRGGRQRTNIDTAEEFTRVRTNINIFRPDFGFLAPGDPNQFILAPGPRNGRSKGRLGSKGGRRSGRGRPLPPVCPADVLECVGGTVVVRVPPRCDFAECPPLVCGSDTFTCPDGTIAKRDLLNNCDFEPCPTLFPTFSPDSCPDDMFQCPDGTFVGRIPPNCDFQECPPAACPADIVPCPDGSFVVRDPLNNCEFPVCPDGQCPLDTQQCPDGTPVSRIPPDCNFAACSTASCPTDVASCPDGTVVSRDPANNCRFMPCPTPGVCPSDVQTCPDGSTVVRDPNDNCEFPTCPGGTCPADIQTCPGGTTVVRVPPDCLFEQCPIAACPGDVRTCPGGSVVVRDPANDCEFQACPNAVRVDATLEYGFFDGTTLRSPTEAEYIGVMVETSKFYTQDLRRTFPNLDTAVSVRSSQSFNPSDTNLPVRINFSLISFFLDGTTNPTQAQILSAIAAADYQNTYRQAFVWNSQPPGTIFFDTARVSFTGTVATPLI